MERPHARAVLPVHDRAAEARLRVEADAGSAVITQGLPDSMPVLPEHDYRWEAVL